MKVSGINHSPRGSQIQFQAITQRMPQLALNCTKDLYEQYSYLRFAKYYEALDDKIYPQNKFIRNENFSFLERIPEHLKNFFVDTYKYLTDFPNITKVSEKINDEFVSKALFCTNSNQDVRVLMAGYDPVCSVGLKHALPGSDIDKAYIILGKKRKTFKSDWELIAQYKGALWEFVDQRILSLNNENTFPEVYTLDGMFSTLDTLDRMTCQMGLDKKLDYFKRRRMLDIKPTTAGEFNILFAKMNDQREISKVNAKNFAYFIESVRDGKIAFNIDNDIVNIVRERLYKSPFASMSNVTQMGAHERQINIGMKDIKTKLRNREQLADQFEGGGWSDNSRFELVKDLVKSVSKDQGHKYDKYFKNDDDIGERYNKLNIQLV